VLIWIKGEKSVYVVYVREGKEGGRERGRKNKRV
jgi:hypothetical protein